MTDTTSSLNMNLPVPIVGQDPGPQFATDVNSCLTLIDAHDHSAGYGVPVTPNGLNISTDLPFNGNNATLLRSSRYVSQSAVFTDPTDIRCVYVVGADLYYNDGVGNNVRITQSGTVAGTPGSISNLTPPASAAYVSADSAFVFQSAANTPANIDGASFVLRNLVANSNGLTLNPPNAMGADYSITLPSLPGATKIMTIDAAGNIGSVLDVDNATLEIPSNVLQVKALGVSTPQLADFSLTQQKHSIRSISGAAAVGDIGYTSAGGGTTTSGSLVVIATLSITTMGSPVKVEVYPALSAGIGYFAAASNFGAVLIYRSATQILKTNIPGGTFAPLSSISVMDIIGAGTYTYTLRVTFSGGPGNLGWDDLLFNALL